MDDSRRTYRLARLDDVDALKVLIEAAISQLQTSFLEERQIAASRAIMGLDTQLIADVTYFIVEMDGELAGCGGWSRRATLYGNDQSPGRSEALLDPAVDAARIRAMYTHPPHVRKGVGRLILALCEDGRGPKALRLSNSCPQWRVSRFTAHVVTVPEARQRL